jgi:hypothetical protein
LTSGCDCDQPCHEEEEEAVLAEVDTGMGKIVFVEQPNGLHIIKDEIVQLAVWRKTSAPKFEEALQNTSINPSSLPTFEDLVTPHDAYQKMKSQMCPPYELRSKSKLALTDLEMEELLNEINQLVRIFSEISQSEFVFVNLHVVQDDGCRFWHRDCVNFRLVKTYQGPCSEWVPPAFSKATLIRSRFDSNHAKSLSPRDVALFKGQGDVPEEDDDDEYLNRPGIVHRSPRLSGACRLVLVLDIPREGWHF